MTFLMARTIKKNVKIKMKVIQKWMRLKQFPKPH